MAGIINKINIIEIKGVEYVQSILLKDVLSVFTLGVAPQGG